MNLYFRLLLFILTLPFIKKITPKNNKALLSHISHQSSLTFRVLFNDLDIFAHMNNGRYLSIMDLGRFHLMAQLGTLKKAYQHGWVPAVGSVKITYIRSLTLLQKYQLTTQILCWDEKWIYMEQQFIDEKNNTLMATALVRALFLKKGKKIDSQTLISTFFSTEISSPPMPERVTQAFF